MAPVTVHPLDAGVRPGSAASRYLIPISEAEKQTETIIGLLPEHLRDGSKVTYRDFDAIDSNEPLLTEIRRAVPLKLLLEPEPGFVVGTTDRSEVTASHFFLSQKVDRIGSFVSHRMLADPIKTTNSLLLHAWLSGSKLLVVVIFVMPLILFLYLLYPPLVLAGVPLASYVAIAMFTTTAKSDVVLRLLGFGEPLFWYNKATIHQTNRSLTQAGIHLFGYYTPLQRSCSFSSSPSTSPASGVSTSSPSGSRTSERATSSLSPSICTQATSDASCRIGPRFSPSSRRSPAPSSRSDSR